MNKLLIALTALILVCCTTDDGAEMGYTTASVNETAATISFEGVWSVDNVAIEQTYIVTQFFEAGIPCIAFVTFPYEAVMARLLPQVQQPVSVPQPSQPPIIHLQQVGYSVSADYYEQASSSSSAYERITFGARGEDGTQFTVALDLLPSGSTFMVGQQSATCILSVKRIELTAAEGQPRLWVYNPEHILTFTSTKRR